MTPTVSSDCPYGVHDCPKVLELEGRIDKMEHHLENINSILWTILGGVTASLVATILTMVI